MLTFGNLERMPAPLRQEIVNEINSQKNSPFAIRRNEVCQTYFKCDFEELKTRAKKFEADKCIISNSPANQPVRIAALTEQGHIALPPVFSEEYIPKDGITDNIFPLITKYCTYGKTVVAEDVLENNNRIWDAFNNAVENDDPEPIKLWHQAGGEKSPFTRYWMLSCPLLYHAISTGKVEISVYLIEQLKNTDELNNFRNTFTAPLNLAVVHGYTRIAQALLENGAKIDRLIKDNLLRLVNLRNTEMLKVLLEHGADVDYETEDGLTALMSAAALGHSEIVKILLEHGAEVDRSSDEGCTALMLTAYSKHTETVKVLLEHGAKLTKRQKEMLSPEAARFLDEIRTANPLHHYSLRKRKEQENHTFGNPSSSSLQSASARKKFRPA